jgi:Zinc-finger associated domain (zf-AD)
METICRTCLSTEQDMENIFKKRHFEEISEILGTVVTSVVFRSDEDLPPNICQKCLQSLLAAYEFCQMCKTSDESLRNIKLDEPGEGRSWTLVRLL